MGAYWHPCSGYGNILRILLFGPRNGTAVLKGLSNIKEWFDRTVVRTGSGQCQVAQEKGNAELQFSVFVSALIHPQLLCHFFATSIRSFSAISEDEKSEPPTSYYGAGNHRYD